MSSKPLTIDQLRDLIHKGKARDPIVFLEAIMNGQDPRKLSAIYELICDIDAFNSDDDIPRSDWNEIMDLVFTRFKYKDVSIGESTAAAKTLAEYLHPKRKQIEINAEVNSEADPNAKPLTEDEIELFKEKFNDEF